MQVTYFANISAKTNLSAKSFLPVFMGPRWVRFIELKKAKKSCDTATLRMKFQITSVVDLDPDPDWSGTLAWIWIRNYCYGSESSKISDKRRLNCWLAVPNYVIKDAKLTGYAQTSFRFDVKNMYCRKNQGGDFPFNILNFCSNHRNQSCLEAQWLT